MSVTLPPIQNVSGPDAVMEGSAGMALTVTGTCLPTVLNPSFTTTVYVVETSGTTTGLATVDVNPAGTEVQLYV